MRKKPVLKYALVPAGTPDGGGEGGERTETTFMQHIATVQGFQNLQYRYCGDVFRIAAVRCPRYKSTLRVLTLLYVGIEDVCNGHYRQALPLFLFLKSLQLRFLFLTCLYVCSCSEMFIVLFLFPTSLLLCSCSLQACNLVYFPDKPTYLA